MLDLNAICKITTVDNKLIKVNAIFLIHHSRLVNDLYSDSRKLVLELTSRFTFSVWSVMLNTLYGNVTDAHSKLLNPNKDFKFIDLVNFVDYYQLDQTWYTVAFEYYARLGYTYSNVKFVAGLLDGARLKFKVYKDSLDWDDYVLFPSNTILPTDYFLRPRTRHAHVSNPGAFEYCLYGVGLSVVIIVSTMITKKLLNFIRP